ncbi:MAG: hypothetical protein U0936_20615 [Planctomycetaceae bacterium]
MSRFDIANAHGTDVLIELPKHGRLLGVLVRPQFLRTRNPAVDKVLRSLPSLIDCN